MVTLDLARNGQDDVLIINQVDRRILIYANTATAGNWIGALSQWGSDYMGPPLPYTPPTYALSADLRDATAFDIDRDGVGDVVIGTDYARRIPVIEASRTVSPVQRSPYVDAIGREIAERLADALREQLPKP